MALNTISKLSPLMGHRMVVTPSDNDEDKTKRFKVYGVNPEPLPGGRGGTFGSFESDSDRHTIEQDEEIDRQKRIEDLYKEANGKGFDWTSYGQIAAKARKGFPLSDDEMNIYKIGLQINEGRQIGPVELGQRIKELNPNYESPYPKRYIPQNYGINSVGVRL